MTVISFPDRIERAVNKTCARLSREYDHGLHADDDYFYCVGELHEAMERRREGQ